MNELPGANFPGISAAHESISILAGVMGYGKLYSNSNARHKRIRFARKSLSLSVISNKSGLFIKCYCCNRIEHLCEPSCARLRLTVERERNLTKSYHLFCCNTVTRNSSV